jgi:multidrug efflux pump subunit AcrB
MAMLGLVTLAGVAVSHAILLVATARRFISNGEPVSAAIARAASLRLRPILMTAITTSLVLAPLAATAGDAATLHRPLALVLIGGLLVSAAASVLVIPCVFVLLDRCRGSA